MGGPKYRASFFVYTPMDEDIKNSILILALENLILDYESALEIIENSEDKEYIQFIIYSAKILLSGFVKPSTQISRPKWNQK